MRHPVIKLAAAAAIVMTVILGLNLIGGPDAAHVAWGRVLQTMETVPTVVFHMSHTTTFGENNTRTDESTVYDAGKHGSRIDSYINGELFFQKFLLLDRKLFYFIRPQEKTYYRVALPEDYGAEAESDTPRAWVKMILSENYTQIGRQTIDGIACEGVEARNSKVLGGNEGTVRLWVDIASNLPVRVEMEMLGMESGQKWPMRFVMDDFQWDIELEEGTFEPQIPPDFTQREEPKPGPAEQAPKAQPAPSQPLTEQERAAQSKVKETVTLFLQACSDRNWDEMLRHAPGLARLPAEQKSGLDAYLGGLNLQVGEPFRTGESNIWQVPCRIQGRAQGAGSKEIRVRYDETLGRFVVSGGL